MFRLLDKNTVDTVVEGGIIASKLARIRWLGANISAHEARSRARVVATSEHVLRVETTQEASRRVASVVRTTVVD